MGYSAGAVASYLGSNASWIVPAVSAAASATSVAAQQHAAKQQQEAQANAMETAREEQAAVQKQADQRLQAAQTLFTPEQQAADVAAAQANRTGAASGAIAPGPTDNYQVQTASAPVEVKSDLDRQTSDALKKASMTANAQAVMKAFGDTTLGEDIGLNRAGQDIGQLANFSQGRAALTPLNIAAAHTAGANWEAAGQDLGTVGDIANRFYLTRSRQPAPGSTSPSANSLYFAGIYDR